MLEMTQDQATALLRQLGDKAHRAANGGLNSASHKATAADLKRVLREIRDLAWTAPVDPAGYCDLSICHRSLAEHPWHDD